MSPAQSVNQARRRYRRAAMAPSAPEDMPLRVARLYRRKGLSSSHACRMYQRAVEIVPDDADFWAAVWETAPQGLDGPHAASAQRLLHLGKGTREHERILVQSLLHRDAADQRALDQYQQTLDAGPGEAEELSWYLSVLKELCRMGLADRLPSGMAQRAYEEAMAWCDPERRAPPSEATKAHAALCTMEKPVGAALAQAYALAGDVGRAYPIYLHLVGRHQDAHELLVGLLVTGAASGRLREGLNQVEPLHPPEVVSPADALSLVAQLLRAKATCIEEETIAIPGGVVTAEEAPALEQDAQGAALEAFTRTTLAAPVLSDATVTLGPAGTALAHPAPFADVALPYLQALEPSQLEDTNLRAQFDELRTLHRGIRGGDPRIKSELDRLLHGAHRAALDKEQGPTQLAAAKE